MEWLKWLFSTWVLIRLSGLLAHFMFTTSLFAGLLGSFPGLKRHRALLHDVHLKSGWFGFLAVILHIVLLTVDHYAPLTVSEILLPGNASYEALWNGIGTVGFYLFGFVLISSDFLKQALGRRIWKLTHWLVLPAWVLMTLHGVMAGTDSGSLLVLLWYVFATLAFAGLVLYRMTIRKRPAVKQERSQKGSSSA